jgi:hypothetical protein
MTLVIIMRIRVVKFTENNLSSVRFHITTFINTSGLILMGRHTWEDHVLTEVSINMLSTKHSAATSGSSLVVLLQNVILYDINVHEFHIISYTYIKKVIYSIH